MNKYAKTRTFGQLVAATVAVAFVSSLGAQNIVSLNLRDGTVGGNSSVADPFGIAAEGTVVSNWNNTNSFGAATPTVGLLDSSGAATGISATVINSGGQQYWGADYIKTPWNFGIAHFTATANPVSLTLDGLNATFPLGYKAIVYVNGAPANPGAAVTDGTTTYFFQTSNPAAATPILITDIDSGDGYDVGNYAVFGSNLAPLMGDSITFTIPTGSIVANNAGIGGVQLVAVPEPTTTALIFGIAVLGFLAVRRRRN